MPLGKLDSEPMVPIDEEALGLVDRITTTRTHGRPLRHPRTGAPADFLFTHHGKRLSQNALRAELNRAAATAGLGHITPHQLRHTYATALINAAVRLETIPGHQVAPRRRILPTCTRPGNLPVRLHL